MCSSILERGVPRVFHEVRHVKENRQNTQCITKRQARVGISITVLDLSRRNHCGLEGRVAREAIWTDVFVTYATNLERELNR